MPQYQIAKYDKNDCLLCRSGTTVLGQLNVRDLRDEYFGGYVVWNVHVYPAYRQQGVAGELIACVLESYQDAPIFINAERFYDDDGPTSEELHKWYLGLGFRVWENEERNPEKTWLVIGNRKPHS